MVRGYSLRNRGGFNHAGIGIETIFKDELQPFQTFFAGNAFLAVDGEPLEIHPAEPEMRPIGSYAFIESFFSGDFFVECQKGFRDDRPIFQKIVCSPSPGLHGIGADAIEIVWLMKRDNAFGEIEGTGKEFVILTP